MHRCTMEQSASPVPSQASGSLCPLECQAGYLRRTQGNQECNQSIGWLVIGGKSFPEVEILRWKPLELVVKTGGPTVDFPNQLSES